METVAMEWHKKGIKTVKEAELDSAPIAKECYQVLKALGINDHTPHPSEVAYIDRWMKEYGFTIDIILLFLHTCTNSFINWSPIFCPL